MRRFFTTLLILSGTLCYWLPAAAFSISPLRYTLTIDPGKKQILALTITNSETSYQKYRVRVGGVRQDNQGRPVFGDQQDVAESWITVDEAAHSLAPGQTKKVFFTVAVPSATEPGTHTAALLVSKDSISGPGIGLSTELAALVTVQVAGKVHESISITTWQARYDAPNKKIITHVVMQNTGTVSVPLQGGVVVTNLAGKTIATSPIQLGNTLLPGIKRDVAPELNVQLAPGPNTVRLEVRFGATQSIVSEEITVWYMPVWLYVLAVSLLVGLAVLYKRLSKKK